MNYELTIGWLYPELMSTYGDRGNVLILQKRCVWRGIACEIMPIDFQTKEEQIEKIDMIFGGGAQDRQQGILIDDLRKRKGPVLRRLLDRDIPGLFVCGSPQLLGHSYMMGDGTKLEGLCLFDMESRHAGNDKPRCIGNIAVSIPDIYKVPGIQYKTTIVGFENHGGRTYLGTRVKPFGTVLIGNGNNGEDKTEGAVYKNWIATYSHGPLLAKNPHIADYLIAKTLEIKYGKKIHLSQLDDTLMWQAHDIMLKRMSVTIG
ncbi:MAG: cobalamin biosynthesis protein CobQ [Candidatus Gottesmanbacteria bacterium]